MACHHPILYAFGPLLDVIEDPCPTTTFLKATRANSYAILACASQQI